ncbi:MAG TPA: hypothetical protein VM450_06345 [Thermomicrobiales bacterium]|nr:hypothetical protein [Thermomicrobiales bacterium]
MDDLRARAATLGRSLALLATYALVIGAASVVMNAGGVVDGEAQAMVRAVLGLWGVAAGAMLWTGQRFGIDGWRAVMIWAVIQIPFYAWNTDGSPFVQVLEFPASFTSQTTVNGEVTSYSEIGINLVGVALAVWANATRERWSLRGPRAAVAA